MGHSHSIYIFDTDTQERGYWQPHLSRKLAGYLSAGYAVVYVVEGDEIAAVQQFSRAGMHVEDYVESGALTIINRDVFYSPEVRGHLLNEQWAKVFAAVEKKRGRENIKGFVAMGMPPDSYFTSEMYQQRLVDYEGLVADNYTGSAEAMCCYTTGMLERMPLKFVMMLLNAHQNTAHSNGQLKHWNSDRSLEVIRAGLNSALGSGVAELIFAILLRDFGMDEKAMAGSPDKLESRLRFLLGGSAADIVVGSMKREFIKSVAY